MNPTGWHVSHDAKAPSNPWLASNLDLGVVVFGETIDALGLEIQEQRRKSFDARRNANGSR